MCVCPSMIGELGSEVDIGDPQNCDTSFVLPVRPPVSNSVSPTRPQLSQWFLFFVVSLSLSLS